MALTFLAVLYFLAQTEESLQVVSVESMESTESIEGCCVVYYLRAGIRPRALRQRVPEGRGLPDPVPLVPTHNDWHVSGREEEKLSCKIHLLRLRSYFLSSVLWASIYNSLHGPQGLRAHGCHITLCISQQHCTFLSTRLGRKLAFPVGVQNLKLHIIRRLGSQMTMNRKGGLHMPQCI